MYLQLRDDSRDDDHIDTDRLSPKARGLATAVHATPLRARCDLWVRHRDSGEQRPWRGWASYPADSEVDPHQYLETEARKVPAGWDVLVPDARAARDWDRAATDDLMTRDATLTRLQQRHGIRIAADTWSGYVTRGHAPGPDRYVGRTPLWEAERIDQWAQSRPGRGTRTDLPQ